MNFHEYNVSEEVMEKQKRRMVEMSYFLNIDRYEEY